MKGTSTLGTLGREGGLLTCRHLLVKLKQQLLSYELEFTKMEAYAKIQAVLGSLDATVSSQG